MIWKNYFQDFWLHSIQASDFTTGIWAHSLAFVRAFTAGHLSWEGYVSSSKYSLSHVIFDTSLAIAGWQHITPGKPSPKNEQGSFMCVMISNWNGKRFWEVRGVSLWLHLFGLFTGLWDLQMPHLKLHRVLQVWSSELLLSSVMPREWHRENPFAVLLSLPLRHWYFFSQISYF